MHHPPNRASNLGLDSYQRMECGLIVRKNSMTRAAISLVRLSTRAQTLPVFTLKNANAIESIYLTAEGISFGAVNFMALAWLTF